MKSSVLCFIFSTIFLIDFVYSAVTLSPANQDGSQIVTFSLGKSFVVACNLTTDGSTKDIKVEWKQAGVPVDEVDSLKGRYKTKQEGTIHKLEVNNAKEEDIKNYTCSLEGADDEEVDFAVFIKPVVKVPENLNTVEFEVLKIHCAVYGKPYSTVSWRYVNDSMNVTDMDMLLEANERISLEKDTEKDIENAVLVISNVQMWDRGEYTCVGHPPHNHKPVEDTCMVRVKDKYAALWPFLGICAEVFVLCAIILIYEKKRNKTELEESDTDQSPDQKNTPDHNKDSNLRHRQ